MYDPEDCNETPKPRLSVVEWLNRTAPLSDYDEPKRLDPFERLDSTAVDRYVGAKIANRRIALKMNVPTLARLLSISMRALVAHETGARRVSGERLVEIAIHLGVAPSFFFPHFESTDRSVIRAEVGMQGSVTVEEHLATLDALMISHIVRDVANRSVRSVMIELAIQASRFMAAADRPDE